MKKCFKCGIEKPRSEFYKHPMMGDGLLGKCKECTKKDARERVKQFKNDPAWMVKERERCRYKSAKRRGLQKEMYRKEYFDRWRKNNPLKRAAHSICGSAFKR